MLYFTEFGRFVLTSDSPAAPSIDRKLFCVCDFNGTQCDLWWQVYLLSHNLATAWATTHNLDNITEWDDNDDAASLAAGMPYCCGSDDRSGASLTTIIHESDISLCTVLCKKQLTEASCSVALQCVVSASCCYSYLTAFQHLTYFFSWFAVQSRPLYLQCYNVHYFVICVRVARTIYPR